MQYPAFVTRSLWHLPSYFLRPIFRAKTGQVNLPQNIGCIRVKFSYIMSVQSTNVA